MNPSILLIYPDRLIPKFSMPPAQIADTIAKRLNIQPLDMIRWKREGDEPFLDQHWDTVIVCSGGWMFCPFRDLAGELVARSRRIIYTQNDFTVGLPYQIRSRIDGQEVLCMSTIPEYSDDHHSYAEFQFLPKTPDYIDWCKLSYTGLVPFRPIEETELSLMYYGALRRDRLTSFEKYLRTPSTFSKTAPVVSASRSAQRAWETWNPFLRLVDPFSCLEDISTYSNTVYMIDKTAENMYCSVSNRFWECLCAGVAIQFDSASVASMRQGGFDVEDFLADQNNSLGKLSLKESDEIRREQRSRWATRDYRQETLDRLDCLLHQYELI